MAKVNKINVPELHVQEASLVWHPGITIETFKKCATLMCLAVKQGNMENTANTLGITRRTLREWLNGYEQDGINLEKIINNPSIIHAEVLKSS